MQSKLCIYFESFFACITKSLYSCIIYPFIFLRVSGHKNVNLFFVQNQRFLISIKKGILYLNNIPQTVDKLGVGCYTQHQVCLQSEALHMQCLFRENLIFTGRGIFKIFVFRFTHIRYIFVGHFLRFL